MPSLSEIKEQFNKVLCYSQQQESVNTDNLFETWGAVKSPYIKKMDGLIYECPDTMTFDLSESARNQRIDSFLEVVSEISPEICDFLAVERDGLIENKVVVPYYARTKYVDTGMRIGKALHTYFNIYCGNEQLEWIIQELSRVIQTCVIQGKLCLSVHPLDYLSLSENASNWRSCHALDGDYCAGNLSYMCDKTTVIAYIKSEKENVKLPHFPDDVLWNNKKWRCLLFFDQPNNIIWAGRQYPFANNEILNAVNDNILAPLNYIFKSKWSPFSKPKYPWVFDATFKTIGDYHLEVPHVYKHSNIYPLTKFIDTGFQSRAYNDLLYSSQYLPAFLTYGYTDWTSKTYAPMLCGAAAPCIHCGKKPIYDSNVMFCRDDLLCSPIDTNEICYCDGCGQRIIRDLEHKYHGNDYCEDCYNKLEIHWCSRCGTKFSAAKNPIIRDGHYYCSVDCVF